MGRQIHTKPQLIDAIQDKLQAFPGIIFNYTQPAEDAVDEAETGLKSALAVKIFGRIWPRSNPKPRTSNARSSACAASNTSRCVGVRGIEHVSLVRELGQPSLTIEPDIARRSRATA